MVAVADARELDAAGKPTRFHLWLVLGATLVCFAPSLAAGFVFDDQTLIIENTYAQSLDYLTRCFTTDLFDTSTRATGKDAAHYYRPLVCVSYALNWAASGQNAFGYHLFNVVAHLVASWLALRIACRWLGQAKLGTVVALVFALHPSRSENVVWISGRTDVLMGLFVLLAVELAWTAAHCTSPVARTRSYVLATLAFCAGLLSKEVAVSLPLFLGVDAWLARGRGEHVLARRSAIAVVAFGLLAVGYLAVRAAVFPVRPDIVDEMSLPPALRFSYALLTLGYYVERVLVPWPQVFDFKPITIADGDPLLSPFSIAVGSVALLALTVIWIRAWKRSPPAFGMLGAGFVLFLPLSNLSYTGFPGTASDRFLYLPLLVWTATLVELTRKPLAAWLTHVRLAPLIAGALGLVFAGVTWVRTLDYGSDEAFWRAELVANPDSPRALAALGRQLALRGLREEGFRSIQQALSPESLRHVLIAEPTTYYVALLQLHGERVADGHADALVALSDELWALARLEPSPTPRRSADLDLALPQDPHSIVNLTNARDQIAAAGLTLASRLGQRRRALAFLSLVPDTATLAVETRFNLALALGRLGERQHAEGQLEIARQAASSEQRESIEALSGRIATESGASLPASKGTDGVGERLAIAERQFDWGNYLLAARSARFAFEQDPKAGWEPFATYLLWSRLDAQALAIATPALGSEGAATWRASVTAKFSPRTRDAIAPPVDDQAWRGPIPD